MRGLINKINNKITISNRSLDEDIAECDKILYRGSTAVLKSLKLNKKLFYLDNNDNLNINPLHNYPNTFCNIKNINDLKKSNTSIDNFAYTKYFNSKENFSKILELL